MFRRLLEVQSRSVARQAWLDGVAVSVVAHVVIVGGAYVATLPAMIRMSSDESPTVTAAEYLIPKEELAGSRPQREQVSWLSLDTDFGAGFAAIADARKDEDRLKIDVTPGEKSAEEKGEAPPEPQAPIALGDSIKTVIEVDTAVVRYEDSAAPAYPETLLKRHIEGMVVVQYVVDTTGHADTTTFRVLSATHNDFARSVKSTLPHMRFHPAKIGVRAVAQLVEQPFVFKIVDQTLGHVAGKKP